MQTVLTRPGHPLSLSIPPHVLPRARHLPRLCTAETCTQSHWGKRSHHTAPALPSGGEAGVEGRGRPPPGLRHGRLSCPFPLHARQQTLTGGPLWPEDRRKTIPVAPEERGAPSSVGEQPGMQISEPQAGPLLWPAHLCRTPTVGSEHLPRSTQPRGLHALLLWASELFQMSHQVTHTKSSSTLSPPSHKQSSWLEEIPRAKRGQTRQLNVVAKREHTFISKDKK